MKLLVDAQLPRSVCRWLLNNGHNAVHTLDLELGNLTPDAEIIRIADAQDRVVVTKDADFAQSFVLRNQPRRLLLVSTGNINNTELGKILADALPILEQAFLSSRYIELSRNAVVIHE